MKNKNPYKDLAVAAALEIRQKNMQPPPRDSNDMICRRCTGLNHFAKNCNNLLGEGRKSLIHCYNYDKIGMVE